MNLNGKKFDSIHKKSNNFPKVLKRVWINFLRQNLQSNFSIFYHKIYLNIFIIQITLIRSLKNKYYF